MKTTGSRPPNGTPAQSIDIEYTKFVRELEKSEITATFQIFSQWIIKEDFAKFLNLVNVFQATLGYESNRPFYEHWYEERIEGLRSEFFPPVPTDFPDINRDFPSETQYSEEIKKLNEHLPAYIASTEPNQGI